MIRYWCSAPFGTSQESSCNSLISCPDRIGSMQPRRLIRTLSALVAAARGQAAYGRPAYRMEVSIGTEKPHHSLGLPFAPIAMRRKRYRNIHCTDSVRRYWQHPCQRCDALPGRERRRRRLRRPDQHFVKATSYTVEVIGRARLVPDELSDVAASR